MKLCAILLLISIASASSGTLKAQQPQTRVISGSVTDSKGEPVIGASVVVKGTNAGINTNIEGKFQLTIPADGRTLIISFIGFKQQEIDISSKTNVSVQLEDEAVSLQEVLVVGYGTQKRAASFRETFRPVVSKAEFSNVFLFLSKCITAK